MVNSAYTFPQAEYSTPHGGRPFHGWKKGFGFGYSPSAGMMVHDPSTPMKLRCTPDGDRGFASSSFWRTKYQVGKAAGFGIGDRPDYGEKNKWKLAPNHYGDVSKQVANVRKNYIRRGMSMSPYYPSMEEKYVMKTDPGPGPAKYNTATTIGRSSLTRPAKAPSFSLGVKIFSDRELLDRMDMPGPDSRNLRDVCQTGKNAPHMRGSLYDISMHGKIKRQEEKERSPGPARYMVKGDLDQYTLGIMISNTKVPKDRAARSRSSPAVASATAPAGFDLTAPPGTVFADERHPANDAGRTQPLGETLQASPVDSQEQQPTPSTG